MFAFQRPQWLFVSVLNYLLLATAIIQHYLGAGLHISINFRWTLLPYKCQKQHLSALDVPPWPGPGMSLQPQFLLPWSSPFAFLPCLSLGTQPYFHALDWISFFFNALPPSSAFRSPVSQCPGPWRCPLFFPDHYSWFSLALVAELLTFRAAYSPHSCQSPVSWCFLVIVWGTQPPCSYFNRPSLVNHLPLLHKCWVILTVQTAQ